MVKDWEYELVSNAYEECLDLINFIAKEFPKTYATMVEAYKKKHKND